VRLARNPGDNIIRNKVRWMTRQNKNTKSSLEKLAHNYCNVSKHLSDAMTKYVRFHNTWEDLRRRHPSVPHLVMHYEKYSTAETAVVAFTELLDFLNESAVVDINRTVLNHVKQPDYSQGGQYAQYCGVDAARELHKHTRGTSEILGYKFDHDTGSWFL